MDIVFCGTPTFAVPSLERLTTAGGFNVRAVVTQPDRPSGRGLELAAPPVKQSAMRIGLPFWQPEKIRNNAGFRQQLEEVRPDAIVVVGYGKLIPQWLLDLPPLGNVNLHASLLPKYRGAAPIQWAIANGETVSGNTTMRLDAGLDTGDILLQQQIPIGEEETAIDYGRRLAEAGADLLIETLRGLENGKIRPRPQDSYQATLAPVLKKEDGRVHAGFSAKQIHDRLRGFQPWPGVYVVFRKAQIKLIDVRVISSGNTVSPGELAVKGGDLLLGCAHGTVLEIGQLQPQGKRAMSSRDFVNGIRLEPGAKLDI